MGTDIGAFLAIAVVVIATPGQDTALTIRNTLLGGRRSGVATAIGVAAGLSVWALATSGGLAGVLQASHPAFVALPVAGAVYLVYLGGRFLRDPRRRRTPTLGGPPPAPLGNPLPPRRA